MIKSNLMPARWVAYKLGMPKKFSHCLNPISGFLSWGSDKGMGIPRESGHEGQQDLIIGHSED